MPMGSSPSFLMGMTQASASMAGNLNDPKLLLLDEATSVLDAESECIVQEALDRVMVGKDDSCCRSPSVDHHRRR